MYSNIWIPLALFAFTSVVLRHFCAESCFCSRRFTVIPRKSATELPMWMQIRVQLFRYYCPFPKGDVDNILRLPEKYSDEFEILKVVWSGCTLHQKKEETFLFSTSPIRAGRATKLFTRNVLTTPMLVVQSCYCPCWKEEGLLFLLI